MGTRAAIQGIAAGNGNYDGFKKTAIAFAFLILAVFGTVRYFFAEENYYPSPGSLEFYLKLSPVIRNLPVIAPQNAPAYFGSTGDGPKPPQSSVSYPTREKNVQELVANISNYLHQQQFALDTSEDTAPVADESDKKVLYQAGFIKAGGNESVLFQIRSLPDKDDLEISVTHFEYLMP